MARSGGATIPGARPVTRFELGENAKSTTVIALPEALLAVVSSGAARSCSIWAQITPGKSLLGSLPDRERETRL